MKRFYYRFSGAVQHVGFRWKLKRLAQRYEVTGFVRNLPDGSVEAQLQGAEDRIELVLYLLQEDPYIEIKHTEKKELPLQQEQEFLIVF